MQQGSVAQAKCINCSAFPPPGAAFCTECGAAVPKQYPLAYAPEPSTPLTPQPLTVADERQWAMFCHLSTLLGYVIPFAHIVAPLILWSMKRDQSALINDQGKEALNFQISLTIYLVIAGALMCALIGFVIFPLLLLFDIIVVIIAATRANHGEFYRYPGTLRFIK